jgi:peroxiredoxin
MRSRTVWLIAALALVVVAIGVINRRWAPAPKAATSYSADSKLAPNFTVTDLDNRKLSLADYKGKVVLLDFWATWCAPCRTEIPHFVDMQNKFGPEGFQVIGISMDDNAKPVNEFYREYKLNYPVAVGDDKLAESYGGVLGLPVNFIIDREGRIYAKHLGATDVSVFDREVSDLLGKR